MTNTAPSQTPAAGDPTAKYLTTQRIPIAMRDELVGLTVWLWDSVYLLHPVLDCLPLTARDVPDMPNELAELAAELASNLDGVDGQPSPWLRTRWACPHLPALVIDQIWELMRGWHEMVLAAVNRGTVDFFEVADRVRNAMLAFEWRWQPAPVRWWLAYNAGSVVAARVRKHNLKADPADRNPFRRDIQPDLEYWWARGRADNGQPYVDYGTVPPELYTRRYCCSTHQPSNRRLAVLTPDRVAEPGSAQRGRGGPLKPPLPAGADMGEGRYFCRVCWASGRGDGGHERYQPPCELTTDDTIKIR